MKLHNNILSNSSYSPMRRIASALSRIALAAFLAVGAASCEDDFEPPYIDNLSVGKEVAVTIPISLPGMDVQSRSPVDETYLNAVHSLWIGIFDAEGNMTSRTRENKETIGWYKVENPSNSDIHELHNVTVYAKTGPSHIVAVANVEAAKGVMSDVTNMTLTDLTTLLNDVVNAENPWQVFNKIAVQSYTDPRSFVVPDNYQDYGLVLSGRYYNAPASHPADWAATNQETTFIKTDQDGSFTLPGAIHLRRLQSHITFNIEPGNPEPGSTEKIVSVKVTSYQVCNTPRYAFAYEQTGNFGDVADKIDGTDHPVDKYYEEAVTVPGTSIKYEYDNDNKNYITNQTFDFWQIENKHTAPKKISDYNEREKRSESDHSIFTSLTGGDEWTNNNLASYVVLTCNVTYLDKINVDGNGNTVSENGEEVYRTGVVRYTIHHGYIDGNANDFNCYRNCDYTYNVEITGLESVRVEAITKDHSKDINGAEGIVTDLTTATIQLDSHFAQFNIALSYDDLFKTNTDGTVEPNPDFGFLINSPYNNTVYSTFDNSGDLERMANETGEREKHKFYNWIEIHPTEKPDEYAKFVPAHGTLSNATESERVIPFWQFVQKLRNNGKADALPTDWLPQKKGEIKYYTIFINEYTYEPRYGEVDDGNWGDEQISTTGKNEWQEYVNQDPRQFYILTQRSTSVDGQSIYARSKYAISQRSIQSYYTNVEGQTSATALGIEHINETQGLNMRNHFAQTTNFSFSRNNGRYNIAVWLSKSNNDELTLKDVSWNDFVSQKKLQQIKTPTKGTNPQNGPAILSVTAGYNPAGKSDVFGFTHLPSTIQLTTDYTLSQKHLSEYDPQESSTSHEDYIEAINACMNRNRDENGNGTIENEELKWYIPASGKYLRAILGRHSLETPIMPYDQVTELPDGYNEVNSRYHIYASNGMVVWAMEGLSANPWNYGNTDDNFSDNHNSHVPAQPAWQVRCIRNLGTNLKTIQNTDKAAYEDKVQRAYVYDYENKIVRMTYYDSNSKRIKRIDGRGNAADSEMPIHSVTSDDNMVFNAFEISETEHITASITGMDNLRSYIEGTRTGRLSNNYCATYSQNNGNDTRGWRLPNQKEIAIMVNLHAIYTETGDSNYKIFSTNGNKFSVSNNSTEYALTCTYTYFENTDPYTGGTTYNRTSNNHNFIGSLTNQGTQMSPTNMSGGRQFYIRCVRDVD